MAARPNLDGTRVRSITIQSQGHVSILTLSEDSLHVERRGEKDWPEIHVPLRNVVWSEFTGGILEVSVLVRPKKKGSLALAHLTAQVDNSQKAEVETFVEDLVRASYKGPQTPRHLRILINPNSGPGKAGAIYKRKVEPIFRAARCTAEVSFTTHPKHAMEIAQDLPLGKYDAVVVVSGDGLVHEVLNGLAQHRDPIAALRTPIVPIPAGSGNGFALNLLGLEEGIDSSAAALNAVKGLPMTIDLFSFTQKDTRVLSFMSQCVGLMAELDLWTEHLRFMGNGRFMVGYLKGVLQRRACPIKLQIKVAQSDKAEIYKQFRAARASVLEGRSSTPLPQEDTFAEDMLPPLRYASTPPEEDGWVVFEKPVSFVYAGKGPFVSRDLMQFPASLPDDGFIDLTVHERVSRGEMLAQMDDAVTGGGFWREYQHYFKAEAYRVEPQNQKSCLSVDGEAFPFEPFQVEVHKGLGRVLSPYGYYNADFSDPNTVT